MTITEVERQTCEARVGVRAGEFAELPIWCSASVALTTWVDINGRTHRACRHHLAAMLRRNPERYLSEIADDPLGQAKAAREISDFKTPDQHGETCWYAGHVPGCSGRAGGSHELLPGWIAYEDADGDAIEVEVSGA
jgi:hypothetical protein